MVFEEGKDFAKLEDTNLHPWSEDKPALDLKLLAGSRIKPGTRLRMSWYHPMIVYHGQVGVCMAEPQIYEIVEDEVKALVAHLHPKRILLNMDEIRFGGTCDACRGRTWQSCWGIPSPVSTTSSTGRSGHPGVLLVGHVRSQPQCPRKLLLREWRLHGIMEVHPQGHHDGDLGGEAPEKSFAFFRRAGVQGAGACYYRRRRSQGFQRLDRSGPQVPECPGVMYTTWEGKYDLLPSFGDLLK